MNESEKPYSEQSNGAGASQPRETYFDFVRPGLRKILKAFQLDKTYARAEGDHLYYHDSEGHEIKVLDLLGGYGANIIGHNHPELIQLYQSLLKEKRPFLAQGSVRSKAGDLGELLNHILKQETKKDHMIHFANTGAEAVDVALKHSELYYQRKVEVEVERVKLQLHELSKLSPFQLMAFLMRNSLQLLLFIVRLRFRPRRLSPRFFLEDFLQRYHAFLMTLPSPIVGLKGAFHGKTIAATALSSNYRQPFERLLPRVIAVQHEAQLVETVQKFTITLPTLTFDAKIPSLVMQPFCSLLAFIIEPIQGEGGIHPIPTTMSEVLNDLSVRHNIPLISDEIQSGMGRTGRFLAGTHFRLKPNIILLSKGLGGSLAKISAICIERSHYVNELGILQTSTFAEDDSSATMALATLRLLLRQQQQLLQLTQELGLWFHGELTHLLFKYPGIIKDIRGKGLMVGIEFYPQTTSYSGAIRFLSLHDKLGYAICSYLLNVHHIRLAPCLSSPSVLRLEPSLLIERKDLERFLKSLDVVCRILENHRADLLFQSIISDQTGDKDLQEIIPIPRPAFETQMSNDKNFRVAFLGYTADPKYMHQWDESLKSVPPAKIESLLTRVQTVLLEPQGVAQFVVRSKTGQSVELQFYGLPVDANFFTRAWASNSTEPVTLIEKATEMAYKNNCRMMSYGGFTSIAVLNGKALRPRERMGYTTGNSLTAGVAFEATLRLAKQKYLKLAETTVAVVGANGNMGRVLSQLFAERASKLMLFVRPGKEHSARDSMIQILKRLRSQKALQKTGIFRKLRGLPDYHQWLHGKITTEAWVTETLLTHPEPPLVIHTDLSYLATCQIILSTSNADHPIIHPEHIGPHPTIICDMAVPEDVSFAAKQLPQVSCFSGGVVELPEGNQFLTVGSGLPWNRVYACLAEVLLLGLEKRTDNFSFGHLTIDKVKWILKAFHKHGFKIDLSSEKTQGHFRGYSHEN